MKKVYFAMLLIFTCSLYALHEPECHDIRKDMLKEWSQHNKWIEQFQEIGVGEKGLEYLREALACCEKAFEHVDRILRDIAGKSRRRKRCNWRIEMKKSCEKDQANIQKEIALIQDFINQVLISLAVTKAQPIYQQGMEVSKEAKIRERQMPPRTLANTEEIVQELEEIVGLYRKAESLVQEAYMVLSSCPEMTSENTTIVNTALNNLAELASSAQKDRESWPQKVVEKKRSMENRVDDLLKDAALFAEKKLMRSAYHLEKQALLILNTLIENSSDEKQEAFEKTREKLQASIQLFEEKADRNRLTKTLDTSSFQEFQEQEKQRRAAFFSSALSANPPAIQEADFTRKSVALVTPLDGQIAMSLGKYSLYLTQFYRFYIQSDQPITKLRVKVYEQDIWIDEEVLSIPLRDTPSWQSYLLSDNGMHIPKTRLEKKYGLSLRIYFTSDPKHKGSFVLSQQGKNPRYHFSFSTEEGANLYDCTFSQPPPWQLRALCKPAQLIAPHRLDQNRYALKSNAFSLNTKEVDSHFSLLDDFVKKHKNDPLALASYVQNEIAFVHAYCYKEKGVFQAPGIQRNPLRVFLEGKGSPWEQCQLLVYLLRQAGYEALYAKGKPYSLSKDTLENLLITQLPKGKRAGLVNYPWVVFFDGEKWVSLFPWMQEVRKIEGFTVYHYLPEEFASADRWILQYLQADERILKHTGPDGDDSAGRLFAAFVKEHLRRQGLSLDDVGMRCMQIKRQFASLQDFPSPKIEGEFQVFDLHKDMPLFAKAKMTISPRNHPENALETILPLTAITDKSIPLHFEENQLYVHFLGEENPRILQLTEADTLVDIQLVIEMPLGDQCFQTARSVSLEKGAEAALCFHFGGDAHKLTKIAFDRFNKEKNQQKKIQNLLSFVGAAYFARCGSAQNMLAELHKVHPLGYFAFGLAKFAPGRKDHFDQKFPQVDMIFLGRPSVDTAPISFLHDDMYPTLRQFDALVIVDVSSNEHQILRDIFSDEGAISTVRLLQLAHQNAQKMGDGTKGFIALSAEILKEIENDPESAYAQHFSHLPKIHLSDLQNASQWNMAKYLLQKEDFFHNFAYIYMTPGKVKSLDGTYQEMGTLIFHPSSSAALISFGSLHLHGGLGTPLPPRYFDPNIIPHWYLSPTNHNYLHSYRLQVPVVEPLSSPKVTSKPKWKPDVRSDYKSSWNEVADPVDVVSGSFYIDEVDLILPGPFPLEIRRNYNSQNPIQEQLGVGWKLSLNPSLVQQGDELYAAEADGTIICYSYNPSASRWEVFAEHNPSLSNYNQKGIGSTANPFHSYIQDNILYGADGSKRFFENGYLRKWVNAQGAHLTFHYAEGLLIRIESSYGEFFGLEYNETRKVAEIYARDGRRVSYRYNTQGDLVKVTFPNTKTTLYEYDSEHRLFRESNALGAVIENIFDEEGRVIEQRSPMGPYQEMVVTARFIYSDQETVVIDAAGGKTTYKIFDKQIYQIIDPLGVKTLQSWFIDANSWFDAEKEEVCPWPYPGGAVRSLKSTTDKRGLTTSYLYDQQGNPVEITLAGADLTGDGRKTLKKNLRFNERNLCIEEETEGQKITTTYDLDFPYLPKKIETYRNGYLISYTALRYNALGQLIEEDQNGAITYLTYNTRGFPDEKTQCTGTEDPPVVTKYTYSAQGQCVEKIKEDLIEKNAYDIMGNIVESLCFSPEGKLLSANYMGYNLNNQLIWQQGANPENITYFDYHTSGKIKAKRQHLPTQNRVACTLFSYDVMGYLTEEIDALGCTTYRTYDALGNIVSQTKEGHTTKYCYEAGGLLKTMQSPSGAKTTKYYTTNGLVKNQLYPDCASASITYDVFCLPIVETKHGVTWTISYDDALKEVSKTHVATGEIERRRYDARGNLIAFTDCVGAVWTKTYDQLNRIKTEVTPTGEKTTYSYAANVVVCSRPNGELIKTLYEAGKVKKSAIYDAENHLIESSSYSYDPITDQEKTVSGDRVTLTWLNAFGKPVKTQQGKIIKTFTYDVCGGCISTTDGDGKTTQQTLDGLGRISKKELPGGALILCFYDVDSNRTKVVLPNGVIWKASYDGMGRKTTETVHALDASTQNWSYTYQEGYLKEKKDPLGRLWEYTYDSRGRLLQEKVGAWKKLYTYDARGLLLSLEQVSVQSSSWPANLWYTPTEERTKIERNYNLDGRLTHESVYLNEQLIQKTEQTWQPGKRHLSTSNHLRTYTYQNNRLSSITSHDIALHFTYDESGSLIKKSSPVARVDKQYNPEGLPEFFRSHLPQNTFEETFDWSASGKLRNYHSSFQEKQFTYTNSGYLQTAGKESYTFDFGDIGSGTRTGAPDCYVPKGGLDAFSRVVKEINEDAPSFTSYDAIGQVIIEGAKACTWDPWGRLIKVQDAATWEASYDGLGRRLQTRYTPENDATITTSFFYDPQEEFQEIGLSIDDKTYWKLHGPQCCEAIFDEKGHSVFLQYNALNELIAVVDQTQTTYIETTSSSYGPQGNPTPITDLFSYAKSLSWHSKSLDPTGLIWLGKRYYNPQTGRFLSPDPVGHPTCLDLYAYTIGDPVNYVDLDGRFSSAAYHRAPRVSLVRSFAYLCAQKNWCNSKKFNVGNPSLGSGDIGFINGINTNFEGAYKSAVKLSEYAQGREISGVYNATNLSGPMANCVLPKKHRSLSLGLDVVECLLGHMGIPTTPVAFLQEVWTRFILTHGPDAKFLQLCYSGGAIHVKNALSTLSERDRQRIIVVAIAPGAIVPDELCYRSYNYVSSRDIVPYLDVIGQLRYGDQLTVLDAHPDAPFWDHGFLSPTFEGVLIEHITDHCKGYGVLL